MHIYHNALFLSVKVAKHFQQGEGASIHANIVNIDVHQCQYWRGLKSNRFAILNSAAGD